MPRKITEADLDYAYGVHGGSRVGGATTKRKGKKAVKPRAKRRPAPVPKLPEVKTVTLVNDGRQWDFTRLPSGEVLQQYHAPKHLERKVVPYEDAKQLYLSLVRQGWVRF